MLRLRTILTALAVLTLSTTTLLAQVRMRTGNWENTATSHGRTATRSHCLKPADAAASNGSPAIVRAETEKALSKVGCKLKDFRLDDNTLTETMVCRSFTTLQETKFHGGDSFETMTTHLAEGVQVAKMKGRRIGDCKAGE